MNSPPARSCASSARLESGTSAARAHVGERSAAQNAKVTKPKTRRRAPIAREYPARSSKSGLRGLCFIVIDCDSDAFFLQLGIARLEFFDLPCHRSQQRVALLFGIARCDVLRAIPVKSLQRDQHGAFDARAIRRHLGFAGKLGIGGAVFE